MGRALRAYAAELLARIVLSSVAVTLVACAAIGAYLVLVLQRS